MINRHSNLLIKASPQMAQKLKAGLSHASSLANASNRQLSTSIVVMRQEGSSLDRRSGKDGAELKLGIVAGK